MEDIETAEDAMIKEAHIMFMKAAREGRIEELRDCLADKFGAYLGEEN